MRINYNENRYLLNYLLQDNNIRESRRVRLILSFCLLYDTGLKVGELSQLKNKEIFQLIIGETVHIKVPYTGMQKPIKLSNNSILIISKYCNILDDNTPAFMSGRVGTNILSKNSIIRDINSYLKIVFPYNKKTTHCFRSTLLEELLDSNNILSVQEALGHSYATSTLHYVDVKCSVLDNRHRIK